MIKVAFSKALLGNTDSQTAQAFITPKNEESEEKVAVLICGQGEDAFNQIRQVGLSLKEIFFDQELPVAQKFSTTLEKIQQELHKLERFDGMLIFYQNGVVYFQNIKYCRTFLKRDDNITELTSADNPGKFISGMVSDQDRMLFITPSLQNDWQEYAQTGWEDEFMTHLIDLPEDKLEEELGIYLEGNNRFDPIALIRIDFQDEKDQIVTTDETQPEVKQEEVSIPQAISQIPQTYQRKAPGRTLVLDFLKALPRLFHSIFFQNRKMAAIFVVVILVLGLILFNFLHNFQSRGVSDTQFQALVTTFNQQFQSAQAEPDLAHAQALIAQAQSSLDQAKKLKPNDSSVQRLQQNLDRKKNEILKIYDISDFPIFLSLDLIKPTFSAERLSFIGEDFLILDTKQRSLVKVGKESKNNQILAGGDKLGEGKLAALSEGFAFVFSQDKGIVRVDLQNTRGSSSFKVENPIKVDTSWGNIVDIDTFAGNIYLLDNGKNQIWKYVPTPTGYSDKTEYLNGDQNLGGAQRMRIDASIWLINDELLKFTQGAKDVITLDLVSPNLDKIDGIYISDETENLYLLDKTNSRVLVFGKDGKYKSIYHGDKFGVGSDLVVDEKGKKIYLLAEGKIYQIDLH